MESEKDERVQLEEFRDIIQVREVGLDRFEIKKGFI